MLQGISKKERERQRQRQRQIETERRNRNKERKKEKKKKERKRKKDIGTKALMEQRLGLFFKFHTIRWSLEKHIAAEKTNNYLLDLYEFQDSMRAI